MFTLVIGGAASGKSAFAEEQTLALPGRRIYLATMDPQGASERIRKHRRLRAGKGFETVERQTDLARLALPRESSVLLECLGNLMANEMFSPDGGGAEAAHLGVGALLRSCFHLTVVTNEVGSGGCSYDGTTVAYMRELGHLNRLLAERADRVFEVVCGMPNILKGSGL